MGLREEVDVKKLQRKAVFDMNRKGTLVYQAMVLIEKGQGDGGEVGAEKEEEGGEPGEAGVTKKEKVRVKRRMEKRRPKANQENLMLHLSMRMLLSRNTIR